MPKCFFEKSLPFSLRNDLIFFYCLSNELQLFFSFHTRPHLWLFLHLVIVEARKITPFFICFITACIINSDVLKKCKTGNEKKVLKSMIAFGSKILNYHIACGSLEVCAFLHRCNGCLFTEVWHNSDWLNRALNFKSMSISWSQTVPGEKFKKTRTSSPNISTYQITHMWCGWDDFLRRTINCSMHYVLNYVESWHHEDKSKSKRHRRRISPKLLLCKKRCWSAAIVFLADFSQPLWFEQLNLIFHSLILNRRRECIWAHLSEQMELSLPFMLSLACFRSLSLTVLFSKALHSTHIKCWRNKYVLSASSYIWATRTEKRTQHRTERMERAWFGMAWQRAGSKERRDNRNVQATSETENKKLPSNNNRQTTKLTKRKRRGKWRERRKKAMQKETGLTYHTIFDESVLYFISINKISLLFSCFSIRCFATQFSLYARVCCLPFPLFFEREKKSILCIYPLWQFSFWYNCLCFVAVSIAYVLSHSYSAQSFYRFDSFSLFLFCIANHPVQFYNSRTLRSRIL